MEKKIKKDKIADTQVVEKIPITHPEKKGRDLISSMVLFTIEGHKTWRTGIYSTKKDFENYLLKAENHPKITAKKWFVIDRINGTVTEEK